MLHDSSSSCNVDPKKRKLDLFWFVVSSVSDCVYISLHEKLICLFLYSLGEGSIMRKYNKWIFIHFFSAKKMNDFMKTGKNLNQLYPLGWNEDYRKPDNFNKRNCLSRFEKAGEIQPDIDSFHPTIQKRFDRFSNCMFKENIFCPLRTLFKIIYNWDYSIFGMCQLFSEPSYNSGIICTKTLKRNCKICKNLFFLVKS